MFDLSDTSSKADDHNSIWELKESNPDLAPVPNPTCPKEENNLVANRTVVFTLAEMVSFSDAIRFSIIPVDWPAVIVAFS